jgi:DNA replication protein DnaC
MPVTDRVCRLESPPRNGGGHRVERIAQPRHAHRCEDDTDSGSERRIAVLGQYLAGPTGVGKTWLACALGQRACRNNRSVLYQRVPRMLEGLSLARGDGRYSRMLKSLARVQVLILDDWGLTPLTAEQRRDLLEIIDDRHGRASTIVTSQL